MKTNFIDNFFPPVCGICGKIGKDWICSKCLYKYKEKISLKCSKINKNIDVNYLFLYEDVFRDKILDYKFYDNSYLFRTFSNIILKNKNICDFISKNDYIVSVPMYKSKKLVRGYNQTSLIANEIAINLNLNYQENLLIKQKDTLKQSSLNEYERKENIKNAFYITDVEKIRNKKILIFDDICTTGSTVIECYNLFKKYTKEISILVLAKSRYRKGRGKTWKN